MGALDGLKILDFTTLLPGPYATLMLADMGAEVLKISSAGKYDLVLDYGERVKGTDISACQAWLGRNKKTMFLNLKTPEAKEIVRQLIMDYDIVIEQFRPGVMQRLGLGYEDLRRVNPHLIYCSLTGYGQTGPLRDAAGHDINYMSRSGIISHAGRADSGPSLMNFQIADIAVGSLNSVIGILAAVISRQATGKGQFIDVSMLDGCVPFNSLDGADFLVSGSLEPKFWEAFCRGIGREDLIAGTVRPENVPEVKEEIRAIFRTKTRDEWTAVFSELDACVQPVMDLQEALLEDPQIRSRGMVVDVDMPLHEGTKVKQMATSINLSETPCEYRFAGYPLGYHTKEIIASLGLDYDDLQAKGVFD